ncbi:hypothetical protein PIB30_044484 [Stylosanthes scabra]|uniref:Uncharacterized protein n=1 Tax=Stylosanthes scabra TaxID=79078 RepID=A0ABU6WHU7_9FABA|nr:hypothetical protein [Stylosanthes scabra]
MNNLTRSSCSFRRQGSSGRIWTDQMFVDPKANGIAASSNLGVEKNPQNIEVRHPLSSRSLRSTPSTKSGTKGVFLRLSFQGERRKRKGFEE